ncbi:tryptophan halogenase family protein [Stakelama tenebrarum]|uniref:Tryptophan 7-halogenase n=1 Tax=Stakelama tenebrarum TaxID=2711215 RepID=A0A6G6Y5Y6_9SPHN|nr:tryptophan halogenase family protein [Sphingosinithalassobacter tenebrarum]QIG80207.1 tryptophan 7-halogenase [Sphingosinithalassobacter tenebrarum]
MSGASHPPIRKLVIVGGGTAGWMTAAAVSRLTGAGVSVTLVESEAIGTVGVGEATIPSLHDFNAAIGIAEDEFVAATQGTFKLGIEFVDWGKAGDRYIHPFGKYGRSMFGIDFHQIWLRQHLLNDPANDPGPIDDYAIAIAAARRGRFAKPAAKADAVLSSLSYAYHLDAGLYAKYLRSYAEANGVVRIEGKIGTVEQAPESGDISAVVLEDGRRIEGEFFVDCSGFRSLLLGQTLGIPYRSWQHWLPCDSAIAIPSEHAGPPIPYTRSSAEASGWRWRIPLQHRVGNGHVFSSAHVDDETALQKLLDGLDAKSIADPRTLRFTAGRREKLWEKNCVAIGLSGGFIEPLESTSIHLIQSGIFRLMALFPDTGFNPREIDAYNHWLVEEYEHVRDFIILHYHATNRNDSDFWNHVRTMEIPDSLAEKLALWREKGRFFPAHNSLFTIESWIAVLLGQNVIPHAADPLVATLPVDETTRFMAHLRGVIAQTAEAMPAHQEFVARHCAAPENRHSMQGGQFAPVS